MKFWKSSKRSSEPQWELSRSPDTNQEKIEMWNILLKTLPDIIPFIIDRWSDISDRPRIEDIEDEQELQQKKIAGLKGMVVGAFTLIMLLLVWNVALTVLVVTRLF